MSEEQVIKNSTCVITEEIILSDLCSLGIQKGDILLVHSSLSSIGWVAGREIAVIEALLKAVGQNGTIVMPSFTGENSDPALWENPPVPNTWVEDIKNHMVPFDPSKTPTREMGKIAEAFWHYPGVKRSNHPQVSFSAWGKWANEITCHHPLSPGFGKDSPLYRLYEKHAKVLLLGVNYNRCTCLHLCEVFLANPKMYYQTGARILENGQSVWKTFDEIDYDNDDFIALGLDYEKEHNLSKGKVGNAYCRLLDMVDICDFGVQWMKNHR